MSGSPGLPAIRVLAWPFPGPEAMACLAGLPGLSGPVLTPVDAAQALSALGQGKVDLALLGPGWPAEPGVLARLAQESAVVIQAASEDAERPLEHWLPAFDAGVQDVLRPDDWRLAATPLRLVAAVLRQRQACLARTAYSTDPATGLPHRQQLLEHISHLLALREREPAPMALLVLRVEGLATTAAQRGEPAAAILRRKLAVRLRAGLRASDVVAALGVDSYGVLLAWIDAPADVDGVRAKLVAAAQRPFSIGGQPVALAVSVGQARYPDDGKEAAGLLGVALAGAGSQPAQGRAGFVNRIERGIVDAANDDEA